MEKRLIVDDICRKIGYQFKNKNLLRQAFVRKSYSEENGGENNERLELVGDRALDIVVLKYLVEKNNPKPWITDEMSAPFSGVYKNREFVCNLDEGELTKCKQRLVEKKTLANRILELGFDEYLIRGKGDIPKQDRSELSIYEDLFEAIIGAVTVDSDWNLTTIQSVMELMLRPDSILEEDVKNDYVGLMYEWAAKKERREPWFKYYTDEEKPFGQYYNNDPKFVFQKVKGNLNWIKYSCVLLLGEDLKGFIGYGESKSGARKAACEVAYHYLEENGLLCSIKDEIPNPRVKDAINQLEILARRGYFKLPEYVYEESHDENGNPFWAVKCKLTDQERTFSSVNSSKKVAKKEAAFKALQYVLESD